ncbi:TPA: YSIRK-type signal peptide-containing protein [Streptococcus suis]
MFLNKKQIFSIRKTSLGVGSILGMTTLATGLAFATHYRRKERMA